MAIQYVCDKCGAVKTDVNEIYQFRIDCYYSSERRSFALCLACRNALGLPDDKRDTDKALGDQIIEILEEIATGVAEEVMLP